jgi:tRNA-splicing ligase RtcB (3'-phosphate/5'-hydroxy nucleic acid ligase)
VCRARERRGFTSRTNNKQLVRRWPPNTVVIAQHNGPRKSTTEDLRDAMKGIEYRHSRHLLDEITGAYKDIDQVMENAKNLVEMRYTLKQFVNVKGD